MKDGTIISSWLGGAEAEKNLHPRIWERVVKEYQETYQIQGGARGILFKIHVLHSFLKLSMFSEDLISIGSPL